MYQTFLAALVLRIPVKRALDRLAVLGDRVLDDGGRDSGSGAATAGIQQGDVILRFGSTDIKSADDLAHAVADAKPDSHVDVVLQRGTEQATVTVEIGQQPASGQ
jgi:S1-C subfamily serine protease